ncbi:uncharacterized protein LOC128216276 [Mya arenaria]|uniref:uncharacterized protein LOC128216276 n=1 Tax=Mya arenaria TaxID=6604 RepID=UPI0022E073C1|nr:uncharacterized protein LOC128216276 [Mya arenaria]
MHVTVTCYKQLSVNRQKTDEPPIFVGPLFIHDSSDFETYVNFFDHIRNKLVNVSLDSLVIGTDDEKAMVKAITTSFPSSTHVLCTGHLRQNAKQRLVDDAVTLADRNYILNKIFGPDGIVSADDSICYDEKCDELGRHLATVSNKFHKYFVDRLEPILKTKVNHPVRHDLIGANWTNNNCESINHVLKQLIDWKSKSLTDLIDAIHRLVRGQFAELRSAIIGTGEFRLAPTHEKFKLTKTDWVTMTLEQRSRHFSKYRNYLFTNPRLLTSTNGQVTIVAPKTLGRKPGQRRRKVNERTTTLTKRTKKDS